MLWKAMDVWDIYLFHGKGGRQGGSVLQLEELLRPRFPRTRFHRPALAHGNPAVLAEDSLHSLRQMELNENAAIIGISLGGLLAAKLQELGRKDLHVLCVSSPTWADGVRLERRVPRRLAFYSSEDPVIGGRTEKWPQLAQAYDLPWLTHDTDSHKELLYQVLASYLDNDDVLLELSMIEDQLREGRIE